MFVAASATCVVVPRARICKSSVHVLLVLRHQLNVLQQRALRRLHLRWADRALFIWLYRRCPHILDAVTIVRPETVVRWHRMGCQYAAKPTTDRQRGA